jgi:hypothetical protein
VRHFINEIHTHTPTHGMCQSDLMGPSHLQNAMRLLIGNGQGAGVAQHMRTIIYLPRRGNA